MAHKKMSHNVIIGLLSAALLIAACAPLPSLMPADSPLPTPLPPTPTPWPPLEQARLALAEHLGIAPGAITLVSSEPMEWADACLELPAPDEMCAQVITPGYRVVLEAIGQQYILHTNASGSQVRTAGQPEPENVAPRAALQARAALAQQLGLAPEAVRIVSAEAIEWPDACLDAPASDEVCAQVVTPGYKVLLEADGVVREYHTDQSGDVLRALPWPALDTEGRLEWRGLTAEGCTQAQFSRASIAFGPCDGELMSRQLAQVGNSANEFYAFVETYQSFSASTAAGTVVLSGKGPFLASPANQRMLAEWAARVVAEAEDEEGLAMWGLGWHREGGIAGFCDDLAIDATGYVELAPCQYESPQEVAVRTLTADELAEFYGWLDTLAPFEFTQQDPATADAMTVRYIFAGRGAQEATDVDRQALAEFSREVLARWPAPTEVQSIQALADVTTYAGPGTQYPVVGQMLTGQTVLVTGIQQGNTWWRVMCPDETFGNCWVSADPKLTQPVAPSIGN